MRIMFLNRTDRVSFVNLLRTSTARRKRKIELFITDVTPLSPMKFVADFFEVVPPESSLGFNEWIGRMVQQYQVKGIFAASNQDLPALDTMREGLARLGVNVLCPSRQALAVCLNKRELATFLPAIGVNTPKIYNDGPSHELQGHLCQFPCIVKPAGGQASVETYLVQNSAQLERVRAGVSNAIIQQFVDGIHYTVDMFGDETGTPFCAVPRVRQRIVGSVAAVSEISMEERISGLCQRIGAALRIPGPFNIQLIKDRRSDLLVHDINPRLASGIVLSMKAGVPFGRWLIDLLIDQTIRDRRWRVRNGFQMFRHGTQMFLPRPE